MFADKTWDAADLDADLMGLGRGHLHILDGQRPPRLPRNSCLASDHLRKKKKKYTFVVSIVTNRVF